MFAKGSSIVIIYWPREAFVVTKVMRLHGLDVERIFFARGLDWKL